MRCIVIGDPHAQPWLVTNALEHANYNAEEDHLVCLGDWLDIGPDPKECLLLLEKAGAQMLIANHELAIATRTLIYPQDTRSWAFESFITDKIINRQWGVVTTWDNIVLSHAGFRAKYEDEIEYKGVPLFVADVNARFWDRFMTNDTEFTGDFGPLWWRPNMYDGPAANITQVVGHTPPERLAEYDGFHVIDPYNTTKFDKSRYRYAEILDGEVTVFDSNE